MSDQSNRKPRKVEGNWINCIYEYLRGNKLYIHEYIFVMQKVTTGNEVIFKPESP
jgi:hypothetical protein